MSLRKGHLRSKQWAPPTLRDDWRDEAKCTGMMDDMISATVCVGCPVTRECGELFDEMDAYLRNGTQREQGMVGTYAGVEHPLPVDHPNVGNMGGGRYPKGSAPVNGGICLASPNCDDGAYRRGMCSKHYQRMMKERDK